jgi:REP element-mobilizing transposase RayT
MSHTRLQYHIVFSTKDRRPMISDDLNERLIPYIGGIIRDMGGTMLAAGGDAGHLHIATILDSRYALMDVMRRVKSGSSKWIHETLPNRGDFGWQHGYAAFTVSQSVMPQVLAYIESQPAHHAKTTFEDELRALLRAHGVEFDERYMLE